MQATARHEKVLRRLFFKNPEDKPYTPKVGDFIDFMTQNNKFYIPAIVKKVS